MKNHDPIYCPKCKLGFAPDTRFCPSCKIELSSKDEGHGDTAELLEIEEDVSSLALLRTEGAAWIRRLQEELDDAGIPHRTIIAERKYQRLSLYVRREDFERAGRIDHEVYKSEVPGTAEVRPAEDLAFTVCPGCGNCLNDLDRECESCGLRLSGSGPECSTCGEALDEQGRKCPHCGAEVS